MSVGQFKAVPPPRLKIPVFSVFERSYGFVFTQKHRLLWEPPLLGAVLLLLLFYEVVTVVMSLVLAVALPEIHRRALNVERVSQSKITIMMTYAATLLVFEIVGVPADLAFEPQSASRYGIVLFLLFCVYVPFISYISVRMSLITTMTAVGKFSLIGAWRLTKGSFWRMVAVSLMCFLPFVAAAFVLMFIHITLVAPNVSFELTPLMHGNFKGVGTATVPELAITAGITYVACWGTGIFFHLAAVMNSFVYKNRGEAFTHETT